MFLLHLVKAFNIYCHEEKTGRDNVTLLSDVQLEELISQCPNNLSVFYSLLSFLLMYGSNSAPVINRSVAMTGVPLYLKREILSPLIERS